MTGSLSDLAFQDLYIRLDGPEPPLFRPLDRSKNKETLPVPPELTSAVERFGTAIKAQMGGRVDGTIDFESIRCRLAQQSMADGSTWVCARQISATIPDINTLGFAPHICSHLHSLGTRDGLILVCGGSGHGKTTTAVGLLVDYLRSYGGTAVTVEDPVEYVLKGRHGEAGYCFQVEVTKDEDWAESLKRTLRWGPRYIYVGEVRTPKAAEQLLHAAHTGHTVITTLHGGMPEEALVGLLFLAEQAMGPGASDILAGSLTALLHQTMKQDGPFVKYLFTEPNAPGDPIRSLIREGKIGMMSTYIDRIAARLVNNPASALSPMSPPGGGAPRPPMGAPPLPSGNPSAPPLGGRPPAPPPRAK